VATKISKTTSKGPLTMADLLAKAGKKFISYSVGQKIRAKVVSKTHKALILDIGGKSEGVVTEKAFIEARDFIKTLKVGDEVTTSVLISESRDGNVVLSLRQAMYGAAWEKLEKARDAKEGVAVYAKGVNPSGVAVECEGVGGFIPTTQLGKEASKNTQSLVGKYFKAVPIEVDRNYNKLVLSEKEVSEASDIKEASKAILKVKEGDVYKGVVTTVANFGCFVKIEIDKGREVEGLVHISELSWGRVERVADVVNKGDEVKIKVIGNKDGKLAFSIKQAQDDPWKEAVKKYKPEDRIKGKVVRLSDFGAFVELEPGIEGLIHITKIPPATRIKEGDEVNCYVEEIDTKSKKLSLGLVLTSKPLGYK
jgi:small subunit ribosomal protein S1